MLIVSRTQYFLLPFMSQEVLEGKFQLKVFYLIKILLLPVYTSSFPIVFFLMNHVTTFM